MVKRKKRIKKPKRGIGSWLLEPTKKKVDNSITKKHCPYFKEKCKGLNCVFGDYESNGFALYSSGEKTLICRLFKQKARLHFEIETKLKEDEY